MFETSTGSGWQRSLRRGAAERSMVGRVANLRTEEESFGVGTLGTLGVKKDERQGWGGWK